MKSGFPGNWLFLRQPDMPALRKRLISATSVELFALDRMRDIAYARCSLVRLSATNARFQLTLPLRPARSIARSGP